MTTDLRHVLVIGQGAAGLAAALSAAEEARSRQHPIRITLIDKAPEADAGGNTRRRPTCGWRRPIGSSRASCRTCWPRPKARATRAISRRWPSTRRRRSPGWCRTASRSSSRRTTWRKDRRAFSRSAAGQSWSPPSRAPPRPPASISVTLQRRGAGRPRRPHCRCGRLDASIIIAAVPGGVGPMTVTMLLANTIGSAERSSGEARVLVPMQAQGE